MEQHERRGPASPPPVRRRRRRSPVSRVLGVVKWTFFTLWTILLIGICTALVGLHFFKEYIETVVNPAVEVRAEDYTMNLSSFIYYQDKETGVWKEWQNVHGVENRVLVSFDQMSDYLWQAAVCIEDERFFSHKGVDWLSTGKAVYQLFQGDASRGGSTLTQQVLKNMTEDNKPYVNRKVREIFRALEFEKNYTKQYILELYLNTIYLGQSCYGVQTAAQFYFGKDAKDLDLAESACIIAITNNPSLYGPKYDITYTRDDGTKITPRELNKERQGWVLDKMAEVINPDTGVPYITEAQRDAAKAEVLQFSNDGTTAEEIVEKTVGKVGINSWFVDRVLREVSSDLADSLHISTKEALKRLYNSGYHIYTTLDPDIQELVESVYEDRSNLDVTSRNGQLLQSGITVMDPYTGNIVAMVGKVGEKQENLGWNCATAKRQVGSSMKPLTAYAPALDAGAITQGSVFDNYPVQELNGNPWPKNSGVSYTGRCTVRYGVQRSINTIAVQALQSVGVEEAYRFATENLNLGLVADDMDVSPLAMGGLHVGLSTVEMAAAYSCFANSGIYNEPRTYLRVTRVDNSGQEVTVLENEGSSHVAMKETTAYLMTEMLKNAVAAGTGSQARFNGMTIAGKTGTTNDNKDRYFVGYTPYYVAAVWTGYETPERISYRGGNPAITMWKKVMEPLHMELPNKGFDNKPSTGLTSIQVCLDSGMLVTDACRADPRGGRTASFEAAAGTGPTEECTIHKMVSYCTEGHCLAGETCPVEVVEERAYLDYIRADYGPGVKADDDAYLISSLEKLTEPSEENPLGGCPVHVGGGAVVDPDDPLDPESPDWPTVPTVPGVTEPVDPNAGGDTHEGNGGGGNSHQGGTTTQPQTPVTPPPEPVTPPTPTTPSEPTVPVTPEPEPEPDPGGGGGWVLLNPQ